MKALFRPFLSILFVLMLAGCSFSLPPNLPTTGGTPTPVNAGTQASTGLPVVTTETPSDIGGVPIEPTPTATLPPVATQTVETVAGLPTAGPTITEQPTATQPAPALDSGAATSTPTATPAPTTAAGQGGIPLPAQRTAIQFPANTSSSVVTATLQTNTPRGYQIRVASGQRMFITIDGDASMQLYDPNLKPLSAVLTALNPVQISISQNGSHYIALRGQGSVTMSVYIPPSGANQNVAAPVPANLNPVQFSSGATSARISTTLEQGKPAGYRINARAGQQMTVTTTGATTLTLLAPDGVTMVPSANVPTHQWKYSLSEAGNYTLVMLGTGPVTAAVSIPAGGSTSPTATATPSASTTPVALPATSQRVTIAPGNTSTTLKVTLASGTPKAYVLRIQAGQTLYVSTTGQADVAIYGPSKTVLTSGHANSPNRWSAKASQTGDYTFVIAGSGERTLTFYIPPL